jgi:hypothetical protein
VNRSWIKTWCRRNGCKTSGWRRFRGYGVRKGCPFRIRWKERDPIAASGWVHLAHPVVDIGEPVTDFDRWANSTVRTIALRDFMREFGK